MLWKHSTKRINFFTIDLKVWENTTVVIAKATFNDFQALKNRMNGHDEDLDSLLDQTVQNILTVPNDILYKMAMSLINYHLAIKILTKRSQHNQSLEKIRIL